MKKLITFLIGLFIVVTLSAQTKNDYQYVINGYGGLTIGGTWASRTVNTVKLTNWTLSGTQLSLFNGATQYSVAVASGDQIDGSTLYPKLQPDTVQYTDAHTLILTDANKWIPVVKATSVAITIPTNTVAFPIGTTINFFQGGAGVIVFKKTSGVELHSFKDSIATDGAYSWAALFKRGTNNWSLYGNIGQ